MRRELSILLFRSFHPPCSLFWLLLPGIASSVVGRNCAYPRSAGHQHLGRVPQSDFEPLVVSAEADTEDNEEDDSKGGADQRQCLPYGQLVRFRRLRSLRSLAGLCVALLGNTFATVGEVKNEFGRAFLESGEGAPTHAL